MAIKDADKEEIKTVFRDYVQDEIEFKEVKKSDSRSLRVNDRLYIPEIKGFGLAVIGILLLVVTFLISLFLGAPETLSEIEGWYHTLRILYIAQFLGLVLTFSGIVWMIDSFYHSWKEAINKVYEKLK